jgi:hypothetical protein
MVSLMTQHFKFFKSSFLLLIDKIVVLEEKDVYVKGLYKLLECFFQEISKNLAQLDFSKNSLVSIFILVDVNSLLTALTEKLTLTYFLPKVNGQVQGRLAFLLVMVSSNFGLGKLKMDQEQRLAIQDMVLDLLQSSKPGQQIYGVQVASMICHNDNIKD